MGNLKLTLPSAQIVRTFKSQITKNGACQNVTQQVTEIGPPLECAAGDRVILFLKVPALTVDGSGVFVASLITRNLVAGNYEYWLQYQDALLVDGVSIDQCDIRKQCCYGCDSEYLCLLLQHPDCEVIQDCVGVAMLPEDGLDYDDDANRFEVALSEDAGNQIIKKADGLYAATTVAGEIDSTLRRDDGGILGVANTAESAAGHDFLFGIAADGSGVRVREVSAAAVMSAASTSDSVPMASLVETLVDYDTIEYDALGIITPGAGWVVTIPVNGRYHITASLLYNNVPWGGFGGAQFASVNLFLQKNADPTFQIGSAAVLDKTMATATTITVQASKDLDLVAGDTIKIFTSHSDNNMPANTHSQVAHPVSHFGIFKIE